MKVNEPYISKQYVNETEVKEVIKLIDWEFPTDAGVDHLSEIIARMWQEIETLRSILRKQIY